MSLALAIRLDRGDAYVTAGEEVSGHVELRSETGADVRRVTLTVGWRTEGNGNRATGTSHEVTLLEDRTPLGRGQTRRLPFRFQAPPGPLSYDGTHLRVVNVISASGDVPWARDPSAELVYDLRRAGDQPVGFQGPMMNLATATMDPARVRPRPRALELLLAIGAALAGIGLAIAAAAAGAAPPMLTVLLVAAGLTVAAAIMLPFRARIAEGRLGRVDLVLDRSMVAPGDTIRAALTFRPRTDLRIQRAEARLRGRERVVRGAGQHRATRQHTFTHVDAPLADEITAAARERVTLWAELPLAPDCPCSFRARDNRLTWEVEVRIAIAGWPDWVASHEILVWPARLPGRGQAPR